MITVCVLFFLMLHIPLTAVAESNCKVVKIEAKRLPDLNIARNAHAVFCVNGEVTVVGGHTNSFIPTATAEYFKDGEWHLIKTEYPHDNGICVVLRSGKVILAGGHAEPLGIGQTFPVEEYDPVTHSFRGFSSLATKRTLGSGIELDNGNIVVTGNWYHDDCIELFDGDRNFSHVKPVSADRASPYVFRSARDDVLILGNGDTHGKVLHSDVVDRLKGEPLHIPLLRQWQPLFYEAPFCCNTGFIGDEKTDDYSWLLPVQDWTHNDSLDLLAAMPMAFMLVRDTTFSLLPTTCPVPVTGPYGQIFYCSPVIADRQAHRGYVHGIDKENRHYVLCVEYDQTPAPLTLYYTDPLPDAGFPEIVLTDDSDLMIVGGHNYNKSIGGQSDNDNFSPLSSVYLLSLNSMDEDAVSKKASGAWSRMLIILAVFLVVIASLRMFIRHRQATANCREAQPAAGNISTVATSCNRPATDSNKALMQRITDQMEEKQLYLNSDLKLEDLAVALATNRNIISSCINRQRGCSFSQFVSEYRVRHAKKLMSQQADMKITEIWRQSGFSTETSFFRSFKAVTGMTPSEWKSTIRQQL